MDVQKRTSTVGDEILVAMERSGVTLDPELVDRVRSLATDTARVAMLSASSSGFSDDAELAGELKALASRAQSLKAAGAIAAVNYIAEQANQMILGAALNLGKVLG